MWSAKVDAPHLQAPRASGTGSDVERTRQDGFVWLRLALTMPFMALAPVFLLARGAPTVWDALAFAFLLAPLCGVHALRRFGRFDIAQAICVAAMILLGVTLACAQGALGVGAVACFRWRRWRRPSARPPRSPWAARLCRLRLSPS